MRLTEDEGVGSQQLRNQHAANWVLELGLRDRPLFLAGLAYWHTDTYRWVTAVVTRDGEILAWDTPAGVEPRKVQDRFAYDQVCDDSGEWLLLPRYRQLQIWNDRWRRRELADHMQRYGAHTSGEFAAGLLKSWLGRDSTRADLHEARRGDDRPLHEQGPVAQLEDAAVLVIVPADITPTLVAQLEKQSPQLAAYVQAFPDQIPPPHRMLPKAAVDLYQEAREVVAASPRSAAALLRVALEALLEELHPSSKKLVERIDELHAGGLPTPQTQAMDVRRLIGNVAAHTGTLHDADNPETVRELFHYLNYLAESSETVRRIAASYRALPEQKRADAERRRQRRPGRRPPTPPKGAPSTS
jgi:hypothetical protein